MNQPQDVEEARLVVRKFVVDSPCDNIVITRKKGYLFKGKHVIYVIFGSQTKRCLKNHVIVFTSRGLEAYELKRGNKRVNIELLGLKFS